MNVKKGSKNAIENRGKTSVIICTKCGSERKPLKLMKSGFKTVIAFQCTCGILNKSGSEKHNVEL
jgi:hypothetical protein